MGKKKKREKKNPYLRLLDVIEDRGWCRFRLEDARGRVCLVGAMRIAFLHDEFTEAKLERELLAAVRRKRGWSDVEFLTKYNDAQRDRRPIVRLLEQLAEAWRG